MAVTEAHKRILANLTRAPYFIPTTTIADGEVLRVRLYNWTETINLLATGGLKVGVTQDGVQAGWSSTMVANELFVRNWQTSELFFYNDSGAPIDLSGDLTLSEMSTMFPAHALTEANLFDGTESNALISVVVP